METFEVEMRHDRQSLTALSHMQYDLFCQRNRMARGFLSLLLIVIAIFYGGGSWWSLLILMPILLTVSGAEASGDWNFFFTCLYIDPILGCLMGHAFYQAVKRPSQDWFSTLAFTLVLFVLPAMKNIGALYAGVAFLTAFAVALMEKEKKGRNILFAIIPVAGAAVSYLSWQWIIRARGTGEFIDMQLSSFTGEKLLNVLKGMTTWGKIPFLYYALFFILVGVVLTFVVKDLPKRTALIGTGGFVLSFLIFSMVMSVIMDGCFLPFTGIHLRLRSLSLSIC